ncbi:MAG: NAD(P)-dependent alcohol dehydrogenase [Rhodospirillales bacterium]|nr:NAD(P)-dependent alcohol dehydrogenase [Rhodospirillales bacterium]
MISVSARAVAGPETRFAPTMIARREPGSHDVVIDIAYAGICHSDIEHARALRGRPYYPLVPGHEIAGTVAAVGQAVTRFAVGNAVGVGNMVWSCRACPSCQRGLEQYCEGQRVLTYNARDRDGSITQGGYSEKIVVDQDFVIRIPDGMDLASAAPLFCAGITMYSPLRHWNAGPGMRVGIVGLGGLGHMGVKLARALGAEVTVLELAREKRADAFRLGATQFLDSTDPASFASSAASFDLIISTVPGNVDLDALLSLLAADGTLVSLAITPRPLSCEAVSLLNNRRSLAGTRSGGISETQEMIDFCAAHGIAAEVEVISADDIDAAYERLLRGDVRYRFVIDTATMRREFA